MNDRLAKALMFSSLADVVVGLVLLVIGWSGESFALTVAGLVLLGMGAVAVTLVLLVRDRPTRL